MPFLSRAFPVGPALARLAAIALILVGGAPAVFAQSPLRVLVIDGQNNHNWQATTPIIERVLEATGRFEVDVATTPPRGQEMSRFRPDFGPYAAVVSNYNGESWPAETRAAFADYVAGGGGFVCVHAADNAFPDWPAYNRMIGLGGWGGRDQSSGPYVRWRDGALQRDPSAGRGGSHGRRHPFQIVVRDAAHPITAGLPSSFMQAEDELYAQLRGPAENMHVLATAYSDPSTGGTGEHEPMLMTIHYGNGRVFHTTLGHDAKAMSGTAFQVTLQRGTEWAATGNVTLPAVDPALLSATAVVTRDPQQLGAGASQVAADAMPNPQSEGWMPLFNGQDLGGWSQKNGTASYAVEEGTIVGRTAVGSPNSFLCSDSQYRNFELTFEVKVDDGLNSGVQIRSQSKPDYKSGRVHGPQVEIEALNAEGKSDAGYLYSEGTGRGWLSTERPIQDAFRNGEWNRYLVRAVGPRIQTWLNGRKIEDLSDDQSHQVGFIGLQVHSIGKDQGPFEVRWREIKIRPLADDAQLQ
jgi:type 1 glutamine amidotransferase